MYVDKTLKFKYVSFLKLICSYSKEIIIKTLLKCHDSNILNYIGQLIDTRYLEERRYSMPVNLNSQVPTI